MIEGQDIEFRIERVAGYEDQVSSIPDLKTIEEANQYLDMLQLDILAINEQIAFYKETGLYPNSSEWNDEKLWLWGAGKKRYDIKLKIALVRLSIKKYEDGGGHTRQNVHGLHKRLDAITNRVDVLYEHIRSGLEGERDKRKRDINQLQNTIEKEAKARHYNKVRVELDILYLACLAAEGLGKTLPSTVRFMELYPDWRGEITSRLNALGIGLKDKGSTKEEEDGK